MVFFFSQHVNLNFLNLRLIDLENEVTAWSVYRLKKFKVPRTLIEEMSDVPSEPPSIPKGKLSIHLRMPADLNSIKIVSKKCAKYSYNKIKFSNAFLSYFCRIIVREVVRRYVRSSEILRRRRMLRIIPSVLCSQRRTLSSQHRSFVRFWDKAKLTVNINTFFFILFCLP